MAPSCRVKSRTNTAVARSSTSTTPSRCVAARANATAAYRGYLCRCDVAAVVAVQAVAVAAAMALAAMVVGSVLRKLDRCHLITRTALGGDRRHLAASVAVMAL